MKVLRILCNTTVSTIDIKEELTKTTGRTDCMEQSVSGEFDSFSPGQNSHVMENDLSLPQSQESA